MSISTLCECGHPVHQKKCGVLSKSGIAHCQCTICHKPSGELDNTSYDVKTNYTTLSVTLSRRDYFAAMAMQNIQNVYLRKSGAPILKEIMDKLNLEVVDAIAFLACNQADALIMELSKK